MIQKIKPAKFVSDKDERLVLPNEMILAENVTVSERADGSAAILKTMKGTSEIDKASGEDTPAATWKIVGSISDEQRGRVYAFVYDTADTTDQRIVMSIDGGAWQTVFKDAYLAFNEIYPVKADLINKAFNQDGNVQTVMYFTDNNNPPRKINIDRALAGEYEPTAVVDDDGNPVTTTPIDLDYALLTMKGVPKKIPTFSFSNDSDLSTNNFKSETFQFACQFLYKDGEESGISSYSELAVSPYIVSKGDSEITASALNGNVCLVGIPWDNGTDSDTYFDVSKVRLLARSENSNPFFVIDEFDPRSNLNREIGSSIEKEVYNADTGTYRFYNDGYYPSVSDLDTGKLFDNVPLKARGQTIASSRLMYSNYTEGYPNFDVSPQVELAVNYGSAQDFGGSYLVGSKDNVVSFPITSAYATTTLRDGAKRRGEININLADTGGSGNALNWPGAEATLGATILPEGTEVRLSFGFDTKGEYYTSGTSPGGATDKCFESLKVANASGNFTMKSGVSVNSKFNSTNLSPSKTPRLEAVFTTTAGQSAQDVYNGLKESFGSNTEITVDFLNVAQVMEVVEVNNNAGKDTNADVGDTFTRTANYRAHFRFRLEDTEDDAIFKIRPYIYKLSRTSAGTISTMPTPTDTSVGNSFFVNSGLSSDQTVFETPGTLVIRQRHDVAGDAADYIVNSEVEAFSNAAGFSFKQGSSHDFGVVYYDKWGRSSFVNKIGSAYVKHPAERGSIRTDDKGGSSISLTVGSGLDSSIPSFAHSYQVVYGGSQYSNVFSYVTGGAYMPMENKDYGTGGFPATAGPQASNRLLQNDHRIFVSLNTIEQHKDSTGSPRDYSFTKGDILRVISYRPTGAARVYPRANDGSIIEFEVVGVETLTQSGTGFEDGVGNPIQWDQSTPQTQGKFLVLRAPRVDGNSQVRVGELEANESILSSSAVASGTVNTSGDTSDTVTVTRGGVNVTADVGAPSFDGITVSSNGSSLDAIVVNGEGSGLLAGDVITFPCTTQSSLNITITLVSGDIKEGGLKYDGFDWFSISKFWDARPQLDLSSVLNGNTTLTYPDNVAPSANNYWGRETVVEILTPKKTSDTPVYYEIGDRITLSSSSPKHGSALQLSQGDVQMREVSCKGPDRAEATYTTSVGSLSDWVDVGIVLENEAPGEFITEKAWSQGRVHAVFERAATINRYNGITFSQPYADDTSVLALSAFVPSQANFFDLPSEHGACNFLGMSSDQLLAIQENKVSRLGINKDVLETGTQAGVVTISSKLINNLVSYSGDFGTSNPESVLIRDGVTYFVDSERRAVLKVNNQGLEVISNKDISSTVEAQIAAWETATGKTIVSGFDPEDNIYYVTLSPQGGFGGYTLGYDEKGGFWQGNYTFYADRYAALKDKFFAFKSSNNTIIHEFKDTTLSNRFFNSSGSPSPSKIRVVFNGNPSMVKTFQAISVEAKEAWSAKVMDSDGRESDSISFSEREDAFYGSIGGIKSYLSTIATAGGVDLNRHTSDSRYIPLGTIASAVNSGDQGFGNDKSTIVLENSLRGMSLPLGYELYYINSSGDMASADSNLAEYGQTPKLTSVDRSTSTVVFEPAWDGTPNSNVLTNPPVGTKLFIANPNLGLTSERIRDRYAVAELSFTPSAATSSDIVLSGEELYAINAHFVNSPLNDSLVAQ